MGGPSHGNIENNADKNMLNTIGIDIITKVGNKIDVTAPTQVIFKVGGVIVDITPVGVAISGGMVTHNGVNIGDTHKHTGVKSGGEVSGVPV